MSFGFSPSDIVALVNLATKTYQGWNHACGKYADITGLLDGLLTLLERVEDEAKSPRSALSRHQKDRNDLRDILQGCERTLSELNSIVTKYQGLSNSRRKNWLRLRLGLKNLDELRTRLIQHTSTITAYLAVTGLSVLTRIDGNVEALPSAIKGSIDALAQEIRAGRREGSVMTTYEDDDKEVWRQFRRELIGCGFKSHDIHKHKSKISEYLLSLAGQGLLEEEEPKEVEPMEQASTSPLATQDPDHNDIVTATGDRVLKPDEQIKPDEQFKPDKHEGDLSRRPIRAREFSIHETVELNPDATIAANYIRQLLKGTRVKSAYAFNPGPQGFVLQRPELTLAARYHFRHARFEQICALVSSDFPLSFSFSREEQVYFEIGHRHFWVVERPSMG